MAANYWDSTQAKYWTFTNAELAEMRQELADSEQQHDLSTRFPLPDRRLVSIYLQHNLVRLAKRMSLRQQALATALVYIKRYYLRVEIRRTNPYLIMTTAVYLACKMEECPQHIRLMLGEAARQWPEMGVSESSKIGECEFALISTLNSRLIVHHPYRSLAEFTPLFGLTGDEQTLAANIINDSYNTDLSLTSAPHIIAIAAIFLAVVLRPTGQAAQNYTAASSPASLKQVGPKLGKLVDWLAESKVDMGAVVDATQEMISLYEVWEQYHERICRESFAKFMHTANK
ncbi:cyclin-like protein [Neohortaea acidophila]|uniref:RNA polymerase II holoenzyme cyclin-like subunit n=1 Tax=Neohortaea acidophila TaxID=245834 RepID=A0A6A6PQI1_9PEZI|nr:cyclin-like protein [Neohortaea acidophila]KAF2482195.1 cyclin-like protein [Neohortaea acidophila]